MPGPGHAIISGGSSGIGLALAQRLVRAGWSLSLLARGEDRLGAARALLEPMRATPAQAIALHAVDVADEAAVATAVGAAVAALGPPLLLIASAGMVVPGRFAALPLDAFRRSIEVNYLGTVNLVRAALPAMARHAGARIVLIASAAALMGFYGYTAYAPSKFAVRGFAEALRSELAPDGIGVTVVFPPDTDTPQLRDEIGQRPEPTRRIAAAARILTADQVADAILAGIRKRRFIVAPGWNTALLARLHSVLLPFLHRFWLDPLVARAVRRTRS
jgi:3-dehydrosphinganine reductase